MEDSKQSRALLVTNANAHHGIDTPKVNDVNSRPDIHYNQDGKKRPNFYAPEAGRTILLLPIFGAAVQF